jgi:hypothetical protein
MATALFVKREDIVRNTAMSGNVDTDKFIQFIKIAQEIHIQNFLGTELYNKISNDILTSSLSGDYLDFGYELCPAHADSLRYGGVSALRSLYHCQQGGLQA